MSRRLKANKCADIASVVLTNNTTPQFTLLNGLVQGPAVFERLGTRVKLVGLMMRLIVHPARTNTSLSESIRFLVVYDRQVNGTTPTLADVLQTRTTANAVTNVVDSPPNWDKRHRFIILYDHRIGCAEHTVVGNVVTNVGPEANQMRYNLDGYVDLKGLPTEYDGATAAIGDVDLGSLHLLSIGNIIAGSEGWNSTFSARLLYADSPS